MNYNETQLILAQSLLNNGRFHDSLKVLDALIKVDYLPAYSVYLWTIWGDGNYYNQFTDILERGIASGSHDCEYIKLWKDFSNRPAVNEYWDEIKRLASVNQPEAILALALHKFLSNEKDEAIEMLSVLAKYDVRRPRAFSENLSYMMRHASAEQHVRLTELFGTILLTDNVEFEDYHDFTGPFTSNASSKYFEIFPYNYLKNETLTNEEFNGTVFSKKRMLERKYISKGNALSYTDIKNEIIQHLPEDVRIMEGLTKNSWMFDENEREQKAAAHSIYIMKKLDDAHWMTLRIGDHTSNIGDYYKYRRLYVPSTRPYANMCIMLHGDREQLSGMKYSFRFNQKTSDPCVTVRDEDFQVYRPFMYTLVHYIPGLIDNVGVLCDAINEWLDGNGLVPFKNPYSEDSDRNPVARITGGLVKIETWDIKYARRKRESENKEK